MTDLAPDGATNAGRAPPALLSSRLARLGTALSFPHAAWTVAACVLAYDLFTLAHDLTPYDAPELALAAAQLGLSHPIGQPLHTLLAAPFAHLPGVAPLTGLGAFSALCHALTVLPVCALAEQLASPTDARAAWVRAAIVGVLLLAPPFWECATRVEVYTLSSFGVAWAFAHAAHVARRDLSPRGTWVLGVALGLTASANAYHAALAAFALSPLGLALVAQRRVTAGALGALLGGLAFGLLPYVYVPLVASRTDVLVWGAPTDGPGLWDYFRGADYGHNRGTTLAQMLDHALAWLEWSLGSGVLVALALGLAGHVALGRERALGRATAPLLAGGCISLLCSHAVFHVDIVDYQNYLAPALAVAAAGTASWASVIARERPALAGVLAVAAACSALTPTPAVWERTRAYDHGLGLAARGALEEAPDDAILVVGSDHWVAPLLYVQEVEGVRPDVTIAAYGLASSSWYWAHLRRRHPDLGPFELRGPGGRDGRLRRMLEASATRPVMVEDAATAELLGLEICDVGYLVRVRPCAPPALQPDPISARLGRALDAIGRGSPASDEALTAIALARGEALWRAGRTREAMVALESGVPAFLAAPVASEADHEAVAHVPPLRGWHAWQAEAAIGDPRRALFLQGMAYVHAGRPIGHALLTRAAALGLPEAAAVTEPSTEPR